MNNAYTQKMLAVSLLLALAVPGALCNRVSAQNQLGQGSQPSRLQHIPQPPALPQSYENAPTDPLVEQVKKRLSDSLKENPTDSFLPPPIDSGVPMGPGQGNYHYAYPGATMPIEIARQARIENAQEIVKAHMNLINSLRDNAGGTGAQRIDSPQQVSQKYQNIKVLTDMGKYVAGEPTDYESYANAYENHINNINKNAIDAAKIIMVNQRAYEANRTAEIEAQTHQTPAGYGFDNSKSERMNAKPNAKRQLGEAEHGQVFGR